LTSYVGAAAIPVAAGANLSSASDPIVAGILDFFAFTLKNALDAKLAVLTPTNSDACPTANRFPYSHWTWWPRNPLPALYVTWSGQARIADETLVYQRRTRDLSVFYVMEEGYGPDGLEVREALLSLADAALATASMNGRHPSYTPPGGTQGQLLSTALATPGTLAWQYVGGEHGRMMPVPVSDIRPGGDGEGANVRFYPALIGKVEVHERVGLAVPTDPDDVNGDTTFTLRTNETGDPTDMLDIMERVVPPYAGQLPPQDP